MGVLIFKGMTVGILPGDCVISLAESGASESKLILSTAYNVIPLWLRIARDSLNDAKVACDNIAQNWSDNADSKKALLVAELAPSMQVIVSCGIALDALYDMLKPYAKLSTDDVARWKRNRTGRGTQIAEVARRVLKFKKEQMKEVKKAITEIIRFRDMAVHPTLELKNALPRPDLEIGVDWKFSAYRFSNAQACFHTTMQIFIFAHQSKNLEEKLVVAFANIFEALEELGVVKINT
ncbi:hypothetical protein [Thiocystis violascens]|uniref:Uncharacterized protein n=1 Tax=Thiocystis violascens (strain ATCC 17096 / DSM 198 / 6111) TaxID=765911 RepID=I3YFS7_THIV6|nr:hypothetical protein [Thiocystis violascens]AFL75845.1 hypothetical protein Thivi_4011 [Thiocystis violascens DSM 198]